jgi:UDP-N-acetylglucosamine acyltransferase
MKIHPSAVVEDGAQLGADVEIGPFCAVGGKVQLGDGVRLISHVAVMGETSIGARTTVHPGAVLGDEAQIHGNDATGTRLEIGEDNVIREGVTLHLGSRKGHGVTVIGSHNFFMAFTHVGHDCVVGDHVTFANGAVLGGHVAIGDNVVLGGIAAVQQFGRIGRGAMLGGVSGCAEDIIPYGIAHGSHCKLAGLNIVGLKRRGVPRENIHALRHMYQTVFLSDAGKFDDRVALAKAQYGAVPEVAEVIAFIEAPAKRPICRAYLRGAEAAET